MWLSLCVLRQHRITLTGWRHVSDLAEGWEGDERKPSPRRGVSGGAFPAAD
ncbi:hypothetical protein [Edwardsiella tarda]|uniref:hypothetical protein n=1 Tax=Edwardsiella tarda TaxID=636 RepID=UPI00351C1535